MHRRIMLNLFAITALAIALLPGSAVGQQKSLKEQLVGTWIYVSSTITRADGTKTDRRLPAHAERSPDIQFPLRLHATALHLDAE